MSQSTARALYFALKPVLPWRLRLGARRFVARWIRHAFASTWPIDERAGNRPDGWPGWPEGKQFAFILTHDVESAAGLARCEQLAKLELELGFRSSFNFIPEKDYSVPPALRAWLTEQGFEVGVHDLFHDGKLYRSRSHFRKQAAQINRYLADWKAVGYRSGFMLHDLDWHHDLNLLYDASTFDTDPFEPQPDGVGTIFPFWVPRSARPASPSAQSVTAGSGPTSPASCASSRTGYVELPYTLPQDSTLFFVLRENGPEIWSRKLDWIVRHGGMALVNIHPDYLTFGSGRPSSSEYPVEYFAAFLRSVQERFGRQYWNPLPAQAARWYRDEVVHISAPPDETPAAPVVVEPRPLAGKRAAVLLYSYYPADPRPRRAAEALVEAGMMVDLFCLSENASDPARETVNGVNVIRVPITKRKDSRLAYVWRYSAFLAQCAVRLLLRCFRERYDLVHSHNMPDLLVFAALPAKLRGARVILDLHDPMPELMTAIYSLPPTHTLVRWLRRCERWSIGFADLALTPNITFKRLFESRSCRPEKMEIVMNSPQQEIFDPDRFGPEEELPSENGEFRIMHHGSIVHRHGVDLLVEAIARVRHQIPGIRLSIYGSRSDFLDTVLETAKRLGIADCVHYHGPKPQTEIAVAIRQCHLGVVPNRRSIFTETNFPTRLFEYLAMNRPVIAPSTQGIRDYFSDTQMLYFTPGDVDDLAARILWVSQHPEETRGFVTRGREVYRQHLWSREKAHFINQVSRLYATP